MNKSDPFSDTQPSGRRASLVSLPSAVSLVTIGAGIGGPPTVQEILKPLHGELPPIVIVQQLESAYQRGFVAWLDDSTELAVRLAADGDELLPGHVYVAPYQGQILLGSPTELSVVTEASQCQTKHRLDRLLESVAHHLGPQALGIVLTGIGSDGARGLLAMRARGSGTVAQSEETSVVASMPRAAVDSGAARATASPRDISTFLAHLTWTAPGSSSRPGNEAAVP